MRADADHIARRAALGILLSIGVIALATAVLLVLFMARAQAQTAGDAACLPGTQYAAPATAPYVHPRVYLTASGFGVEGAAVHWSCWTGTAWRPRARIVHAQDAGTVLRAEFDRRIAQWAQAKTAEERVALARQWDASTDLGLCDRHIANAGYAARLCRLVEADQAALRPTAPWQPPVVVDPPPPPPPPPPAEVWTVVPLPGAVDRPTRFWPYQVTAGGSIRSAPERVPVGAPCDPAVGDPTSNWRGVLGRADRVALCVKR